MNEAVLIVLVAGLLPVVCAGVAKWGVKGYDNHHPRSWMARQVGYRARADAAQLNSFEAFPFFAAGMVLALFSDVDQETVEQWGWFFVAMRVAYIYCYVTDRAALRSIVWMLGYAAVIRLYLLAI
jgi:uncharacterized MAPEG superfamily protein